MISIIQFSALRDGSSLSGLSIADGLLKAGHQVHVLFAAEGPMVKIYSNLGCEVEVVAHKNWLRGGRIDRCLRNVLAERYLAKSIAERLSGEHVDLVYVNTGASYAGAVAANLLGLPCVWHLRELFVDAGGELSPPSGLRWWVRRQFCGLASQIVVNSQAVANNLLDASASEAKVVPNAVDKKFFDRPNQNESTREKWGIGSECCVIGIPGTLRPVKGHRFAFESLEALCLDSPNVRILVTGGVTDEFGEVLKKDFSKGSWMERIAWAGEVSDMPAFYRSCDLVVVPSRSESFGRTVIEAMACSLPVVATRVGGIPEIIDDGENGLLVDYGDENALRSAVKALLENPTLKKCLGDAAYKKAQAEYSEVVHARRILEVVNGV